ncbi:hypothetical protein QAD02_018938 [Eretmocerus hayati]|uniref:Uncharacterized protein n=1 Tax=Eretmocerus hayati TaxID=131215 RepID=A0ACC2PJE0_9HYME|nr:hypothetical protein QAD02_018938 [Eretmocerus hayati]
MEKMTIEELKAVLYWTAVHYQQNVYEISSDWNKYSLDEHLYLKNYVSYALYGPPDFDEVEEDCEDKLYKYNDSEAQPLIETIYTKIVEHGTQLSDEKEVLCNVLYSCIYDEGAISQCDELKVHELIHIIPVFKVQKNVKLKDKIELQNWYIDTEARVYKNWRDYLKNNNLPTCVMISPKDGVYQADLREVWSDTKSAVWVEIQNIHTTRKITSTVDIASTVVNFGCVGVGIAALFNPISGPVLIAGVVGATVSGAWGGGRAVQELVDRGSHDQSIANRQALPAWLALAGNTLGMAASGGSALLSRAIRTGTTVGKGAQLAHDAIVIGNLLVNSTGVINTSYNMIQKYRESGEVSAKDLFFLTAHVLFVCNSAVKMRLASEIIKSDQNEILKEYEDSLRSKRHKKEFRRLVRNTGSHIADEISRNEQIIRSLTKISNRDEFFATMVQNRKTFASTGTQLSFAEGQVQINGITLISPSTFSSMSKDNILNLINQTPTTDPSTHAPPSISTNTSSSNLISANALKAGISSLKNFCVQKAVASSASNSTEYKNIINDLQNVPQTTLSQIMKILLSTGLVIAKRVVVNQRYTEEEALADATNFVWDVVKINVSNFLPGVDVYLPRYQHYIKQFVEATYIYVKNHANEWVEVFLSYVKEDKLRPEDSDVKNSVQKSEKVLSKYSSVDSSVDSRPRYNDILFMDPTEVLSLPKEISAEIIDYALMQTGSKLSETEKISKELVTICNNEVSDFFSIHPTQLDWKPTAFSNEIKGLLKDLECFDKKSIILYKLLVISINIVKGVVERDALKLNDLADVMKLLWIFINITFNEILPETNMFDREYESFVVNIIIGLYRYQINEPIKWSSAFHEYKTKFCMN